MQVKIMRSESKPTNISPLCKSLYCKEGTIPLYTLLLIGSIGLLSAFIFEYILSIGIILYGSQVITFCIAGIHIHHGYIGIILLIISSIAFIVIKSKHRLWIIFFIGLGLGLGISDLITHLVYEPFLFYC